jgi:hypothetical protein
MYNEIMLIAIRQIYKKWGCLFVAVDDANDDIDLEKYEFIKKLNMLTNAQKNKLLILVCEYISKSE